MKWAPGALFCEQVGELTRVFSQWNECEQTVVLYALLRRIPAVQARFLAQALQHSLIARSELDTQELNANNPAFINSLMSECTEVAINQILAHLPLLRPGNVECKQSYLSAIPELVSHCVSTGQFTEQTQQLLSYTLIHPAITSPDRRSLSQWLRHLEERITGTPPIHSLEEYTNAPNRWDITWNKNSKQNQQPAKALNLFTGNGGGQSGNNTFNVQFPPQITRQRRSNSLTPPVAPPHHLEVAERANNANNSTRHKPRSFSVSGDNSSSLIGLGPLSPQSSCTSSGSEGRLDEASSRPLSSGMRDVPRWLKTLRLHKYSYLFTTMSYEEMLQLTEDQLAEQGVTKGARHKLALSISKLQQRYSTLVNLEKELLTPIDTLDPFGDGPTLLLISTLDELNTILMTPLKPSQEDDPQDIPAQFTKVIGKLCSRLVLDMIDEHILVGCINILEKVLQHDCFTPNQKEKVQQWRSRLGNPRPTPKWVYGNYSNRRFYINPHTKKPSIYRGPAHDNHLQNNKFMTSHRNSISTPYLQNNHNHGINSNILRTTHVAEKRPSLQENSLEQLQKTLQRTFSAPRDHFHSQNNTPLETTEPEINSRLESLCLRMTEQAIGGFGEV